MAKLKVMDTTVRNGQQSLLATRMSIGDMQPILGKIDKVGHWAIEAWGGATFDTCLRFLAGNPWERLRTINASAPYTSLAMLSRVQNLVGCKHYSKDIVNSIRAHSTILWLQNLSYTDKIEKRHLSAQNAPWTSLLSKALLPQFHFTKNCPE